MNTSVQVKTHTSSSAKNKNVHNLREGEHYENINILILKEPKEQFSKSKKVQNKIVKVKDSERQKELKRVNSSIGTYQKRVAKLDEDLDKERILKMQEKIKELIEKRELLKSQKVDETRGRKKEKTHVEFELCLTGVPPENKNEIEAFTEVQSAFLTSSFFKGLELVSNAVHLDQSSVHSHAIFKIPENTTWKKYLKQFGEDGREIYKMIQNGWHALCKQRLEPILGKEFEPQQSAQKYDSLRNFKLSTKWDKRIGDNKNATNISAEIQEHNEAVARRVDELLKGSNANKETLPDTVAEQETKNTIKRSRK